MIEIKNIEWEMKGGYHQYKGDVYIDGKTNDIFILQTERTFNEKELIEYVEKTINKKLYFRL